MSKKNILIIMTGGTISMERHNNLSKDIINFSSQHLLNIDSNLLKSINIESHVYSMKPSPYMTPNDMLSLAQLIESKQLKNHYDGFVITHGTDTLEETAFVVDLYLNQFSVPVVFTGSMRNYSDVGYDGLSNLVSSLLVACDDRAKHYGVLVLLNDVINTAFEVTKTHSVLLDTFKSLEFGPIGLVDDANVIFHRESKIHFSLPKIQSFTHLVHIVKAITGDDGLLLKSLLSHTQGVILEGFGRGNVPDTLIPAVELLLKHQIPVVLSTRTPMGRVYATYPYLGGGGDLKERGVLFSPYINSQKTRLLLMYALASNVELSTLFQ
jgi:L-asparaginase